MSGDELRNKAGIAAARAILHNLPVDAFGQEKRLREWAAIWGNVAAGAVLEATLGDIRKQVAEEIAQAIEAERDDDDFDTVVNRDLFVSRLARIAREIGWGLTPEQEEAMLRAHSLSCEHEECIADEKVQHTGSPPTWGEELGRHSIEAHRRKWNTDSPEDGAS